MEIKFTDEQKGQLLRKVIAMYMDDFDEEISDFKAEQLLDAILKNIAPAIYNTAIIDMKLFMMNQLEDLDAIYSK